MKEISFFLVGIMIVLSVGCSSGKPAVSVKECRIIIFHNGQGQMCLELLDYLGTVKEDYPRLVVEEYLTTKAGTRNLLDQMKTEYGTSRGVSSIYSFLPISFIGYHAYSGYDDEIRSWLEKDFSEVCT